MFRRLFEALSLLASLCRILLIRLNSRNVSFGPRVRIYRGVILRTFDGGRIRIGAGTEIWPGCVIEASGGSIAIGADSLINFGSCIVSTDSIAIGRDALIAEHVTIRDQDHAVGDLTVPYSQQGRMQAPVRIGANVWLGAKVTVTKGVTIGDGAIVGANAVVTRDLAANGRFAGVPARPIRSP